MKTHYIKSLGSLLLATTVITVSGMAEAGKGSGAGRQGGGFSGGNSAMHGASTGRTYGSGSPSGNQYRYQYQHRHQNGKNNHSGQQSGGHSGNYPYSDDRRLSQKDFQGWLNQDRNAQKRQQQSSRQYQGRTQRGL